VKTMGDGFLPHIRRDWEGLAQRHRHPGRAPKTSA
jgi:hypothetical protein